MLTQNGGQLLRDFTERTYQPKVTQVTAGVWQVLGLGHSNAVFIEGASGALLVDTLDSLERGRALRGIIREKTGKEVKTILYTHGHPDHRGGAGAFADEAPEIIAFAPKSPALGRSDALQNVYAARGGRQFGYALSDAEAVSQGIGPREGVACGEHRAFVPPTTVYAEDRVCREIDGVSLELARLPGETEDQMAVWLPEKKVLCCGDNYYGCFPNLYAIRGGQYRDITAWLDSLDALAAYPAEYLLPGHTAAVTGRAAIRETLVNFKNAIDDLLTRTLEGMGQGKSEDELAAEIRLAPAYAALPYLGEYYGCAEWTVRAIYNAYLGWFDGNPTHLHPLPPRQRAARTAALMGGAQAVLAAARQALGEGEYQWCLELCDLAADSCPDGGEAQAAVRLKAEALQKIALQETSANGRHYYLACAKELLG